MVRGSEEPAKDSSKTLMSQRVDELYNMQNDYEAEPLPVPNMTSGPRQANLVLIAYASSEGSGEPAHLRSLTRTSAARSYKQ